MASETEFWWLRLKSGNAFKVFARELQTRDAYSILEVARTKTCIEVPIHKLMLFESEKDYHEGEAVRNGLSVDDIRGGNDDLHPLYVSYPDECPDASAQVNLSDIIKMQQSLAQGQEKVLQTLLPLCQQAFELVPASSSSWDADWHAKVCTHYRLSGCMILSQTYPETHTWFCQQYSQAYFGFCVSEHIYHKKQTQGAAALGIDVTDPRNGLPLLKHFEILYQDGDMTLFPCAATNPLAQEQTTSTVQIHIAPDLHRTPLQWVYSKTDISKEPDREWCVHGVEPVQTGRKLIYPEKLIKLGDLHGKVIQISPRPFMRSLYMQARMAHRQHSEFPDPDKKLDVFKSQCPNRMDYVRQCLGMAGQSVADAIVEEPVEWDEDE